MLQPVRVKKASNDYRKFLLYIQAFCSLQRACERDIAMSCSLSSAACAATSLDQIDSYLLLHNQVWPIERNVLSIPVFLSSFSQQYKWWRQVNMDVNVFSMSTYIHPFARSTKVSDLLYFIIFSIIAYPHRGKYTTIKFYQIFIFLDYQQK